MNIEDIPLLLVDLIEITVDLANRVESIEKALPHATKSEGSFGFLSEQEAFRLKLESVRSAAVELKKSQSPGATTI